MISYLAAVGCGVVVGSLMASVVFFAGVGIVLQVIGSVDLPDLKIKR
jgi:formate hydrogenlyase subunit 3/multisubunit Na+/H+ antiporter MnhD subunit